MTCRDCGLIDAELEYEELNRAYWEFSKQIDEAQIALSDARTIELNIEWAECCGSSMRAAEDDGAVLVEIPPRRMSGLKARIRVLTKLRELVGEELIKAGRLIDVHKRRLMDDAEKPSTEAKPE